jgi:hypothetical protein
MVRGPPGWILTVRSSPADVINPAIKDMRSMGPVRKINGKEGGGREIPGNGSLDMIWQVIRVREEEGIPGNSGIDRVDSFGKAGDYPVVSEWK